MNFISQSRQMIQYWRWVPAALISLTFLFVGTAWCENVTKIIAKVNSEIITSKDLRDYCTLLSYRISEDSTQSNCEDEQFMKEALGKLIEDKLVYDKAKKEDLIIPSYLIQSKLEEIIVSYPSMEAFEESLIEKGLTVTRLKEKIKEQYLVRQTIDRYVRFFISVSPQEISQFYKDHANEFSLPATYVLWIGKSQDKSLVDAIAETIRKKGILEAKEVYPNNLIKIESRLDELLKEVAEPLQVMSEGRYLMRHIENIPHVIYLEKKIPERGLTLEEARDKVYTFLWEKKFKKKFDTWIAELKKDALIKIYSE
ncbi:MAG: peptidyl-prolyl cis-trans isomerase [Candidatus Omnitrophota bacterium]|nr:MAG: peptidyl-prolyl cis-trans isomerase [Candidatus Omnitrophota bacterium]